MPLILHLETATSVCSVALSKESELLSSRELNSGYSHSENLTVFCREVLKEAQIEFRELDAVSVSKGPGSYTGLRIGVSAAKGFCYSLDIPLIAIPTLKAMAYQALRKIPSSDEYLFCPMIDARRMEVYCAVFDGELKEITPVNAHILDANSFTDILKTNKIAFFGNGSSKAKDLLQGDANAFFFEKLDPSATAMVHLAEEAFEQKRFEDVAYLEPYYLKEFIGKK